MRPLSRSIAVGQAELRAFSHMPAATKYASTASRAASHTCLTPLTSLRSRTPLSSLSLQSRYLRGAGANTLQQHRCAGSSASASTSPAVPPPTVTTDGAPGMFTSPALVSNSSLDEYLFCSGGPLIEAIDICVAEVGIHRSTPSTLDLTDFGALHTIRHFREPVDDHVTRAADLPHRHVAPSNCHKHS